MIDLIAIVVISLLLVPLVIFTSGALRIALGLAFVLFFPGYTLIAALFPRKSSLDGIERLALSFGLSIAVVPLIGLVLNYTPWGIRLYPILISLLLFIVIMAIVAWFRRWQLYPEERFQLQLNPWLSSLRQSWSGQGGWDKTLTGLLVVAIIGSLGTLGYVIAKPKVGEKFTEFYVLGPGGKAEGYPQEFTMREGKLLTVRYTDAEIPRLEAEGKVIVGVINREHESTAYRVEIAIDEESVGRIGPITLEHEEKKEQEITFTPTRVGPNQKVEFVLYKGEGTELYRTLHLWIDVKEAQ